MLESSPTAASRTRRKRKLGRQWGRRAGARRSDTGCWPHDCTQRPAQGPVSSRSLLKRNEGHSPSGAPATGPVPAAAGWGRCVCGPGWLWLRVRGHPGGLRAVGTWGARARVLADGQPRTARLRSVSPELQGSARTTRTLGSCSAGTGVSDACGDSSRPTWRSKCRGGTSVPLARSPAQRPHGNPQQKQSLHLLWLPGTLKT